MACHPPIRTSQHVAACPVHEKKGGATDGICFGKAITCGCQVGESPTFSRQTPGGSILLFVHERTQQGNHATGFRLQDTRILGSPLRFWIGHPMSGLPSAESQLGLAGGTARGKACTCLFLVPTTGVHGSAQRVRGAKMKLRDI